MNIVIKHIELIERIDQLIRLQATGSPGALASKLGISKTQVYRLIDIMKDLNAPIIYKIGLQSFIYEEEVRFRFGFVTKDLDAKEVRSIYGGNFIEKNTNFMTASRKMVRWYSSIAV
ncbi:hypothetical protein U6A24_06275 [Aquimarina gracilis]|uniref:HTH domain-containing protein n=1 Tax=Aquimarina gracilis TaxID=874422 RepID=A0ABU5ZSN2_9FLAO|nr:hypothetical protein [Aquimarina gracilis]MEB3345057.1 hypothetical protein [Aquimarina gracilis]